MSGFNFALPSHLREAFAVSSEEDVRERLGLFASLVVPRLSGTARPLPRPSDPEDVGRHFSAPFPATGAGIEDTLDHIRRHVVPHCRESVPDLGNQVLDGSRQLNSLGAWVLLRTFGRDGYARIVEHLLGLTSRFSRQLEATGRFEMLSASPELNLVVFRLVPESAKLEAENQRNETLFQTINRQGEFAVGCYRHPSGRFYLRAVFVNPVTRPRHVEDFVSALARHAEELFPPSRLAA